MGYGVWKADTNNKYSSLFHSYIANALLITRNGIIKDGNIGSIQ